VKSAEDSLSEKSQRIDALNSQIAEMERSGQNLSDAYKAALLELGELTGEVKHLREAVEELKTNLQEVKGERDTAQAKVKSLTKENRLLKIVLVARTVLDIGKVFF
jgi:chromosome segregation ATPase